MWHTVYIDDRSLHTKTGAIQRFIWFYLMILNYVLIFYQNHPVYNAHVECIFTQIAETFTTQNVTLLIQGSKIHYISISNIYLPIIILLYALVTVHSISVYSWYNWIHELVILALDPIPKVIMSITKTALKAEGKKASN